MNNIANSDLTNIQEELWNAWCGIKKIPNHNAIEVEKLSAQGRELLEAAIAGERFLEISTGLLLQGPEVTFNTYRHNLKPEKTFWICQFFLSKDGTLITEENAINFRNFLENYCNNNGICLSDLEKQYLKKIHSLPFFPVHEWLFQKELEYSVVVPTKESAEIDSGLQGFEKMRFHLKNLTDELFGGFSRVIIFITIGLVIAGAKYLSRDW